MKPLNPAAALLLALALPVPSLAFIGHGIDMFKPLCAFSCRSAISTAMLACSEGAGQSIFPVTPPACYAEDTPFLTTLAYCIESTCAESVEGWVLEKYWREQAAGDKALLPKWTYREALSEVSEPPSQELGPVLNYTAVITQEMWEIHANSMDYYAWQELLHARYGYRKDLTQKNSWHTNFNR